MEKDFFVDRKKLTKKFKKKIEKDSEQNFIYILSGDAGYGKSAFFNHIIKKLGDKYASHKVPIPCCDKNYFDEGYFFQLLVEQIDMDSKMYNYESLQDYLKSSKDPIVRKQFFDNLVNSESSSIKHLPLIYSIINHFIKIDKMNSYQYIYVDNKRLEYLTNYNYLESCLQNGRHIIVIPNGQLMDQVSKKYVAQILRSKKLKHIIILVEYLSASIDSAKKFGEYFIEMGNLTEVHQLKKLDKKNVEKILRSFYKEKIFLDDMNIQQIYFDINGNLRELEDMKDYFYLSNNINSENSDRKKIDYTLEHLKSLQETAVQVLCFICAHQGQVSIFRLIEVLSFGGQVSMQNFSLLTICDSLEKDHGFISMKENNIAIENSSIIELLNMHFF